MIHVSVLPQLIKRFTCGLQQTPKTSSNTSRITDRETDAILCQTLSFSLSLSLSLSQGKKVFPCKCQPSNSVLSFTLLRHLRGQSSKFTGPAHVHHTERQMKIKLQSDLFFIWSSKHVSWLDYTHITENTRCWKSFFSIIKSKNYIWCHFCASVRLLYHFQNYDTLMYFFPFQISKHRTDKSHSCDCEWDIV